MTSPVSKLFLNRPFVLVLLMLVWVVGVLSWYFFYHQQVTSYQNTINAQIERRVGMLSELQAELIDKEFSFVGASLKQLGALSVDSPAQVEKFAEKLKSFNPTIWHIYIADNKGEVTYSTKPGYVPPMSVQDYFTEHTKDNLMQFFISSPRQSIIQESSIHITISYPIHNVTEQFVGVVVATLKSDDLTAQLGSITKNKNISAVLTDPTGKLIWSSMSEGGNIDKGDIYNLCKGNRFQASTAVGIYRIKLEKNAQCNSQFLDKWGMYSIVMENLASTEQMIQQHHQQLLKRHVIFLVVFTTLLIILGHQLLKQITSRQLLTVLNHRNKTIINAMPDLLLTIRDDGTILDHEVQDDFPLLLATDKLNGMNIREVLTPGLVERKFGLITKTLQTGKPATIEYPLSMNGREYYFLERLTMLDAHHVLAFIIDITNRREAELKLEWQAYHDDLTGLANRVMFFEFLSKLVLDYRRNKRNFVLLFVDLNSFKAINDEYGHQAGDEVLKHTASQLSNILRQTDTVARLGGDEFAVLLPETGPNEAQRVVEIITETIKQPFNYNGNSLIVSASIGIAACPYDAITADELLSIADKRMYVIKSMKRKRLSSGR